MKHAPLTIVLITFALLETNCARNLPVVVKIVPNVSDVASNETLQFTATVLNTPNTAVTWSSCAGTISQAGLFTAPAVTEKTVVCISATSQADPLIISTVYASVSPASLQLGIVGISTSAEVFGSVTVGTTQLATETLSNSGTSPVDISSITVSGTGFQFTGIAAPVTLNPSETATFEVAFVPSALGEVNGNLTISSNASNPSVNVSLSGTGVSPGVLQSGATSLEFGYVSLGSSKSLAETITNSGGSSITISGIQITGSGFSLGTPSPPIPLPPGQATTFDVAFEPTLTGTSNGAITIISTASDPSVVIPLSGNGTGPTIGASNFGMQCGIGDPIAGQINCYGQESTPIIWPSTQAQPGLLRLHDSKTYWAQLNPSSGTYKWTDLDEWLDLIAQHEPIAVSQVFTWVPCWDTVGGIKNPNCGIDPNAPTGTNYPPMDLTSAGSATFNAFITAFVTHCSLNGNCVGNCPPTETCATTNIIKYYEMWNEWDIPYHWTNCGTTMEQCAQLLYAMVSPATEIIRANVSGAVIMTPSATPESSTYSSDLQYWLNYEMANGRISDWVAWHVYLTATASTTNTPEAQWNKYNKTFIQVQQSAQGWSNVPWVNSETNFNGSALVDYHCPPEYSTEDCAGQIVRWQLLHDSNGSAGLYWYYWLDTIGSNPLYEPVYYQMMQYLSGGSFPQPASCITTNQLQLWSLPFIEADGVSALWIWTTGEAGTPYIVPEGRHEYRDLYGDVYQVVAGQQITATVMPILLE